MNELTTEQALSLARAFDRGARTWIDLAAVALIRARRWTKRDWGLCWMWLPYCLHSTERPDVRCVVNRHYKCLGGDRGDWHNYESATAFHLAAKHFDQLRTAGVVCERGYLYDDRTNPWASRANYERYRDKLERVIQLAAKHAT